MRTLVQFSDTHVLAEGQLLHDRVDTFANLEAATTSVAASGAAIDALILSGDLTDSGDPVAYARLRALVEPLAADLGARVVYAMGNHDERRAFRSALLDEPEPRPEPCDEVHWLDDLRIVVLDSTTPGRHDGRLDPAQLEWLTAELSAPAPAGTVLVVHHPPIPSPVPAVELLTLRGRDALADVVRGTDVRIILSGHAHHTSAGTLAGVPVWIAPATAYAIDTLPPAGRARGVGLGAYTRIDIHPDTVVATAIGLPGAPAVYDEDEQEMLRMVRSVVEQPE